jgi:hypothetical protein
MRRIMSTALAAALLAVMLPGIAAGSQVVGNFGFCQADRDPGPDRGASPKTHHGPAVELVNGVFHFPSANSPFTGLQESCTRG